MSRLIRDNGFSKQYAARITDHEDGQQHVVYLPWSEDAVIWRLDRRREYLDGPEAEELALLLASYWEIGGAMPPRVARALSRADYVPRFRWADLALSSVVSGLEALLTVEQTRSTRNFKRRTAALAEELGVRGVDQASRSVCTRDGPSGFTGPASRPSSRRFRVHPAFKQQLGPPTARRPDADYFPCEERACSSR